MTNNNLIAKKTKIKLPQTKYVVLLIIFAASLALHIITRHSTRISDAFNFGFSNFIRGLLAGITSIIPISIGETVVIFLPLFIIILIVSVFLMPISDTVFDKVTFRLLTLVVALYALFAFSLAPAYGSSKADALFGVNADPLSADELSSAAIILANETNTLADEINFNYGSFSKMEYDFDVLTEKLLEAYDSLEEKYDFIGNFKSRLKPIALSEAMTYTHISGVYTYYTGESNINTNFPDYTIPFTAAHEMAHQRGFARENEANFVAFLVCMESNDPYIRYSGYLNMFEYVSSPLYSASSNLYYEALHSLDIRVKCELAEYGEFFNQYRDSTASKVSGTINDTYLKSQGVEEGEKSYGLVVDLAVNYILDNFNQGGA